MGRTWFIEETTDVLPWFHDGAYFEGKVKVENYRGSEPEVAMMRELGLHLNDGEKLDNSVQKSEHI